MTEEERDNGLESLFRNKLEENEMVAGSDLTGRFMRRLDRREFLRFNPARLNIFYVLAVAAGLTVAGLLLQGPDQRDAEPLRPQQVLPQAAVTADDAGKEIDTPEAYETPVVTMIRDDNAPGAAKAETTPGITVVRPDAIRMADKAGPVSITVSKPGMNEVTVTSPVRGLSVEPSVTSGCVPLHVRFVCIAAEDNKVSWSFGDGGTSFLRNPDYVYDIPGNYHVIMTVTDSRGRTATATTVIEVRERPVAAFEVRNNDALDEGDKVLFVNMSEGAVDYLWDFGDGTFSTLAAPSYRYERMGTYDVKLVVWSAGGCVDSVTMRDLFTSKGLYIRFPNAFVPGTAGPTGGYYNQRTDEYNQVFHPVASGVDSYNLKIYSKAGMLVFESNDLALGWDGYYKGILCSPGVYVWKVRGTYRNGQPIIMAGDVTLVNYR